MNTEEPASTDGTPPVIGDAGSRILAAGDVRYSQILDLQRSGPVPLYFQLAGSMEAAVAAGSVQHGTMLPSDQVMARELKLAPATVRHAWDYLESKGLMARRKWTGTIVL